MTLAGIGFTILLPSMVGLLVRALRNPRAFQGLRSRVGATIGVLAGLGFVISLMGYLIDREWLRVAATAACLVILGVLVMAVARPSRTTKGRTV